MPDTCAGLYELRKPLPTEALLSSFGRATEILTLTSSIGDRSRPTIARSSSLTSTMTASPTCAAGDRMVSIARCLREPASSRTGTCCLSTLPIPSDGARTTRDQRSHLGTSTLIRVSGSADADTLVSSAQKGTEHNNRKPERKAPFGSPTTAVATLRL